MAAFKLKIKLRSTGRLLIVAPVTRTRVAACWWVHLSSGLPADYLKGSKRVLFAATPTLRVSGEYCRWPGVTSDSQMEVLR